MDELERNAEELTLVPNPKQSDGRTGAWCWYPDEAITEIVPDGGSKALRFRSIGHKEWSGIAIAFLNASGAGSCYDASACQGIEFRIRGAVKSEKNANRVDASLVTAETQAQKFGGDLVGEGAHFFKTIQLSAEWQVVRLRWSELSVPNWGDTTKLTAPAVTKLQAISFSPLEEIADIFIDDSALF